jgi:tetratricopeptide (TPR) repeat protein
MAAIMAIGGALIPFLMARKDKEIIELDRQSIRQDKESIKQDKIDIEQDKAQVRAWLDEIERLKHKASEDSEAIRKTLEIVSGTSESVSEDVQQTAKKTAEDETADPLLRLRAKAVEASRPESAQQAYTLWSTLADFNEKDANAQMNAGYWAGLISRKCIADEKPFWLNQVKKFSERALIIDPSEFMAANNWGVALADEANALSAEAPDVARELRKQAEEKYRQILEINPDYHEAANNWANILLVEANTIAASDPNESTRLLDQIEQLLLQHAEAAPGVVAYNLACVHGVRGDVKNCLHWLKVAQEHKTLPACEHVRKDRDIDPVRNDPEFIEWFKQVCP